MLDGNFDSPKDLTQGDSLGVNGVQDFRRRLGTMAEGDGIVNYGSGEGVRGELVAASQPEEIPHDEMGRNDNFWKGFGTSFEGDGIINH